MEEENHSKIYKIPAQNKKAQKQAIIGLIDCSGSMSSWWKMVAKHWNEYVPKENCHTILFDDNVHKVPNHTLSERIFDHGGGMTDIPKAF